MIGVKVTNDADEIMARVLSRFSPAEAALGRSLRAIFDKARGEWPVSTGKSRAELTFRLVATPDGPRAVVSSPTPYSADIRARKLGGRQPFEVLIRQAYARALPVLGADFLARVVP